MHPIVYLIETLLSMYNFALIAWVVLGWLIATRIVNSYNNFVYSFYTMLSRVLNPAISLIRRWIPGVGGVDLSPIILIIFINFLRYTLRYYFG